MTAADTPPTTGWGTVYADNVAAIVALGAHLGPDELALDVPATPSWRVHDLLAHLAGAAADLVTGRMAAAPSPEWTSRHVAERVGMPVADLVGELASHQDAVVAAAAVDPRPALVWDVAVHVGDLYEALALGEPSERLWRPVLDAVAPLVLDGPGTARGTDGSVPGTGSVAAVPPYELFRGLFSRRSRAQMAAWGVPLSPRQLDDICVFGPREDDQPVPG